MYPGLLNSKDVNTKKQLFHCLSKGTLKDKRKIWAASLLPAAGLTAPECSLCRIWLFFKHPQLNSNEVAAEDESASVYAFILWFLYKHCSLSENYLNEVLPARTRVNSQNERCHLRSSSVGARSELPQCWKYALIALRTLHRKWAGLHWHLLAGYGYCTHPRRNVRETCRKINCLQCRF